MAQLARLKRLRWACGCPWRHENLLQQHRARPLWPLSAPGISGTVFRLLWGNNLNKGLRSALVATVLILASCDELEPIVTRYHWLTSPASVTLNDFKRVFGAPADFVVAPDDCPNGNAFDISLDVADTALRNPKAALPNREFWLGSITEPSETWFSFVNAGGDLSVVVRPDANFSKSSQTSAEVGAGIKAETIELVFANVRRRVDLSQQAQVCLANSAKRACATGKTKKVAFARSLLYGSLVRIGSKKLKVASKGTFSVNSAVEFSVSQSFDVEDIRGGWIGKLNTTLVSPADVGAEVKTDLPELMSLIQKKRFIGVSQYLDRITERYGVVGVELETLECGKQ